MQAHLENSVIAPTTKSKATVRRIDTHSIPSSVLWAVAILSFSTSLFVIARHQTAALDLVPVWTAVRAFLHHQSPYAVPLFVYPPSLLLLAAPLGLVEFSTARLAFLLLDTAAILFAGALCLRLFNLRWRSTAGAVLLFALAIFLPVRDTLSMDNVNGFILMGEIGMILAAARRRWLLAGALLGCTLAIKPVLLPLLLVLLLYRRWRSIGLAIAIPALLSLLALPLTVEGGQFFTHVIPFLLNGNAHQDQVYNVSLAGVAGVLGLPAALTTALRLVVLIAAAVLMWQRWRAAGDDVLRLVELSGIILLATFLVFSFSWSYYPIYLLPLLVWMVNPASRMNGWITWVALYCIGGPDVWYWQRFGSHGLILGMLRIALGCLLLLIAFGLGLRQRRVRLAEAAACRASMAALASDVFAPTQ